MSAEATPQITWRRRQSRAVSYTRNTTGASKRYLNNAYGGARERDEAPGGTLTRPAPKCFVDADAPQVQEDDVDFLDVARGPARNIEQIIRLRSR